MYAAANKILGNLVKVTPSSTVVGDLALHLVAAGADPADFAEHPGKYDIPDSVIGFLSGELGDPPGGWPEPFRSKALAGRTVKPAESALDGNQAQALLRDPRATLNSLLFPGPTREFLESRERYGDISVLDTVDYLYGLRPGEEHEVCIEEGKNLLLAVQSVSPPDERGIRTIMCTINGHLRPVNVRDRSIEADAPLQEKADSAKPGHVAAPFGGIVTPVVAVGETVAIIEAMKMEAAVTTPLAGSVSRIAVRGSAQVDGGDLILVVT
jgi:pyruvate carboxylase